MLTETDEVYSDGTDVCLTHKLLLTRFVSARSHGATATAIESTTMGAIGCV